MEVKFDSNGLLTVYNIDSSGYKRDYRVSTGLFLIGFGYFLAMLDFDAIKKKLLNVKLTNDYIYVDTLTEAEFKEL